jgi:hypothetical protein
VFAWEELEHWEVELDLGVFQPGNGFLGDEDDAWDTSLEVERLF